MFMCLRARVQGVQKVRRAMKWRALQRKGKKKSQQASIMWKIVSQPDQVTENEKTDRVQKANICG